MTNWLKGKMVRVIRKHGLKLGIFIICWEICSHVVFPALTAHFASPWIAWIWYTPIDELIVYPIVMATIFRS